MDNKEDLKGCSAVTNLMLREEQYTLEIRIRKMFVSTETIH